MPNKIEILVEVDPNGKGAAGIRKITAEVTNAGKEVAKAGQSANGALSGLAGGFGIPTTLAGITAGVMLLGKESINAANANANATRILKSDAQSAGLAFETATEQANAFGKNLALTAQDASKSFGQFIRVVSSAGEVANLDKYRKQFENLIAAYGLSGQELTTLTSQLLNGQDEALNKLGIADPSKLYEEYAKRVNKTVEALSDEEKTRARLLAVTEKGAQFEGAAQERLASQVGQWQQLGTDIANATTRLGEFLQKQTLIGDIPGIISGAMSGRNPLEVVRERQQAQYRAQENALRIAEEKRVNEYLNENYRRSMGTDILSRGATFETFNNLATVYGSKEAEKMRDGFIEQYKAIFKDKSLNETTLIFAEQQFNNIKGIFTPEKRAEIQAEINKLWDGYGKAAFASLKSAREATEKSFTDLADKLGGANNPLVKVITEGDEAARNIAKTYGIVSNSIVRDLQKVEAALTRQRVLSLQLDADLKANALRREARELRNPTGLTGAEERSLDVLGRRLTAATETPNLLAIANAISSGRVGNRQITAEELLQMRYAERRGLNYAHLSEEDKFLATRGRKAEIDRINKGRANFVDSGLDIDPEDVQRDIYARLDALQNNLVGGEVGRRASLAVSGAISELFTQLAPDLQARIATGAEGGRIKEVFSNAFRTQAQGLEDAVGEEIAKAKVVDKAIEAARADIRTIEAAKRNGLDTAQADARLLAVSGDLGNNITADIAGARIEALQREADRQNKLTEKGEETARKAREQTDSLIKSIDALAGEIRKPQNRRLLIDISNKAKADVRDELYGSFK